MRLPEPWNSVRATLERLKAEAIAELDAEDGFHVDHHDRFSRTPAKDFNKKPVLCAAHVVGIADPYYRSLEAWNVRDERDRQRPATSMVRKGWNCQELRLQSQPYLGLWTAPLQI